jgi:Flp pilus assembly protein TadG
MKWLRYPARDSRPSLIENESGAAALEFAVIVSVILALLGGAVDLIDEQTRRREVDRIAVEVAEALARCPDTDCVRKGVQGLIDKSAVVLDEAAGGSMGTAEVARSGDVVVVIQGSMTYLPTDVNDEVKAVLEDQDVGIAVLVNYTYKPLIGLLSPDTKTIRRFAVALRAKNVKMV